MMRFVIIGSGAAGLEAAETLAQCVQGAQITLVSNDRHGHYSRPGLAYYLNGEIPREQLFPFRQEELRRMGLKWVHAAAASLFPGAHQLRLGSGHTLVYDRLLLATGASAQMPDLPGIQREGVVKLDDLDDAEKIRELARRRCEAIVVGGGITALELVEGMAACGARVSYLIRGDRFWSNVLDPEESRLVEGRLQAEGVRILTQTQVTEILGDRQVKGVRTQAGQTIPCQLAAFAVGIKPRLELARAAGLQVKRGILVNEYLQTSQADIFAAGDGAEIINSRGGESILESLWNPARQQGRTAALNMSGERIPYRRGAAINVTRLAGLVTTIIGQIGPKIPEPDKDTIGILRGDSEGWRQVPDAMAAQTTSQSDRLRLYIGSHTISGAIVMGDQALSRPLQHLIERQVDIRPIRAALVAPGANLAEIIQSSW